jgi:hypothetical protein
MGKIHLPFLVHFLSASVLGVSASAIAENSGG